MRVAYIGNFRPERSTENALAYGLEQAGATVIRHQQDDLANERPRAWARRHAAKIDLLLYTRSHTTTALRTDWCRVWRSLDADGVITASFHLDVFVGVQRHGIRASAYHLEPLLTTRYVFSPDPALATKIDSDFTRHIWLPPAADVRHTDPALHELDPRADLRGKVLFVGSRYGVRGAHPEYPFRAQLLDWLTDTYGDDFIRYGAGAPAGSLRGRPLWDVYASDAVIVGDACFAGDRPRYWSDRIPETLAWGGLLVHPGYDGIASHYPMLWTYGPGDLASLRGVIDYLRRSDFLHTHRQHAAAKVREHDLYIHRARALLQETGLCPRPNSPSAPSPTANPSGSPPTP